MPNDSPGTAEKQIPQEAARAVDNFEEARSAIARYALRSVLTAEGWEANAKFTQSRNADVGQRSKADTFSDALAEQRRYGTEFIGFEGDKDFDGLPGILKEVFGEDLLDHCLIEKIVHHQNEVLVVEGAQHYLIPADEYEALLATTPAVAARRFRAFNASSQNAHPAAKRYDRLPIVMYSFVGESLSDKEYLPPRFREDEKLKLYKLGTVAHEVAHSVYGSLLDESQLEKWRHLNESNASLTAYASSYEGRSEQWLEEQFGEAVRLYLSDVDYLHKSAPELLHFIEKNFPSIKRNGLSATV